MTTKNEIRVWLEEGAREGATHTIIACDTFDHEDFPVHVHVGTDVRAEIAKHSDTSKMLRVMEVYSHHLDLETQLAELRAWNI